MTCSFPGPELVSQHHIGCLTTTWNCSSRGSDALFWPPLGIRHVCGTHIINNILKISGKKIKAYVVKCYFSAYVNIQVKLDETRLILQTN